MFNKILKDQRGFTIVEILGVIILITLLLLIAIPAISKQLEGGRENYYVSLEKSVKAGAQDYLSDSRYGKPSKLLYSRIIEVDDLVKDNYIDEVKDYVGKTCNNSYVVVVKVGDKTYDYTTCLSCAKDGYYTDTSEEKSDFCNEAWKTNNGNIYYEANDTSSVSIPYGDLDNDNLTITYNIVKKDSDGNELFKIENAGTLYPTNIDILLNGSVGSKVELKYALPSEEVVVREVSIINPS